jgi:GWxTD domain-containing protein
LICSAARKAPGLALLALITAVLTAGCGSAPARNPVDLTNPFLGPETSGWLVGPVARLATPQEIDAYLAIQDEEQAGQFIEAFWARRDPNGDKPGNPIRQAFDERSLLADKAFTEAGFLGRRTDRGTIFILYGSPRKMDHEVARLPGEPPIELWIYDETSPAGLDGRRPSGSYRFIKRGDLTVAYVAGRSDIRLRRDRTGMPPDVDVP